MDGSDGAGSQCSLAGVAHLAVYGNAVFAACKRHGQTATIKVVSGTSAWRRVMRAVREAAQAMGLEDDKASSADKARLRAVPVADRLAVSTGCVTALCTQSP